MPHFVWFGILGLVLLYAAGIITFLVKRKNIVKFRRYHPVLGTGGAVSLTIHAVWANLDHAGHSIPPVGWIGLVAIAAVFFGYYAAEKAGKARDKKWGAIHWKVQLAALVIATCHAAWFMARILGK
ncbi:MAG: hypothetical protein GX195_02125 [Firmicutes bacterium]|nr:hypothetical protein [Bacillota bacterium]